MGCFGAGWLAPGLGLEKDALIRPVPLHPLFRMPCLSLGPQDGFSSFRTPPTHTHTHCLHSGPGDRMPRNVHNTGGVGPGSDMEALEGPGDALRSQTRSSHLSLEPPFLFCVEQGASLGESQEPSHERIIAFSSIRFHVQPPARPSEVTLSSSVR